jgi:glycosyltransferase involved in cell wall biosynthesis
MATDDKIRVTLFITELALGGTPRRVQALAERLDRGRFEPHVLSLMPGGAVAAALRAADVPVHTLGVRRKFTPLAPLRLWAYLRRVRPQVFHAFNFHANLLAKFVGKKLCRLPVVIVSEASVESAKPGLRVALDRWTAEWPDAHYANAKAVGKQLVERERVPDGRVWMVPTGVDTKAFAPQVPDESFRAALGIPRGEPLVVSVGRLDKYKGQEYLLEALNLRMAQGRPHRLLLVGDGPLRSALHAKAVRLGIADRVVFAGAQDDVAPFLALADCFALASTEEGLPGSLLEAMSMTTPCLATASGGVAEVILDGKTGFLARPGDAGALSQKFGEIFEDLERSKAVARAGRELVERDFTVEQMIRRTEAMYEDLLDGPGTPSGREPRG